MHDYEGVRIEVLSTVEAIRKRPEMYIGRDSRVYADRILALVLMDHLRATAAERLVITITIGDDWRFRCEDNGAGIAPVITVHDRQMDPGDLMAAGPGQGQLVIARVFATSMTVSSTHERRGWRREYTDRPKPQVVDLGPTTETGTTTEVMLDRNRLPQGISPTISQSSIRDQLDELDWWATPGWRKVLDATDLTVVDRR